MKIKIAILSSAILLATGCAHYREFTPPIIADVIEDSTMDESEKKAKSDRKKERNAQMSALKEQYKDTNYRFCEVYPKNQQEALFVNTADGTEFTEQFPAEVLYGDYLYQNKSLTFPDYKGFKIGTSAENLFQQYMIYTREDPTVLVNNKIIFVSDFTPFRLTNNGRKYYNEMNNWQRETELTNQYDDTVFFHVTAKDYPELREASRSEVKKLNQQISKYYYALKEAGEISFTRTASYKFNKTVFTEPTPLCGYSVVTDFDQKLSGFTVYEQYHYQRGFAEKFKKSTDKFLKKYGKINSAEVSYGDNNITYAASVGRYLPFTIDLDCNKSNKVCSVRYQQKTTSSNVNTKEAVMKKTLSNGLTIKADIQKRIITPWYHS